MPKRSRSALDSSIAARPESSMASVAAAMAYWMKMSIFFCSFLSMNLSGSKPRTSPAILQAKSVVSNRVIIPIPLLPARRAAQVSGTVRPQGLTVPMPVMTTRRRWMDVIASPRMRNQDAIRIR